MRQLKTIVLFVGLIISSVAFSSEVLVENPALCSAHFNPRIYNSFPEVEIASQELDKNGNLQAFLTEARDIAISKGLESHIGVRLIHRHFEVEDDERMVETLVIGEEGKMTLVTQPEKETDAVPASWVRTASGWEAFEYSRDKRVKDMVVSSIVSLQEVALEINALSEKYGLTHLLAVSILAREWTVGLPDDIMFLERSYLSPTKQSIVTVESAAEETFASSIITAWEFSKPITHACVGRFVCATNDSGKHYSKERVHMTS
jgi:hypothetical protein